jgi:hypothetical protein
MGSKRGSEMAFGLVLVLVGLLFLAVRFVPGLERWFDWGNLWPLIIIGVGAFLFLMGLLTREHSMAVPACIVGGIGLLLFWQNATGHWESWAWAWTLIPGFVGVGIVLSELLSGNAGRALKSGGPLLVISFILFGIFGSFLGGPRYLRSLWPLALILLGLVLLARGFMGSTRRPEPQLAEAPPAPPTVESSPAAQAADTPPAASQDEEDR